MIFRGDRYCDVCGLHDPKLEGKWRVCADCQQFFREHRGRPIPTLQQLAAVAMKYPNILRGAPNGIALGSYWFRRGPRTKRYGAGCGYVVYYSGPLRGWVIHNPLDDRPNDAHVPSKKQLLMVRLKLSRYLERVLDDAEAARKQAAGRAKRCRCALRELGLQQ